MTVRTPMSTDSRDSRESRRSRIKSHLSRTPSRSGTPQPGAADDNPFDQEHVNPLESVSRWRLAANAMALRSGASFAFSLGNRSSPAPPPPTRTLWLDSTLSKEHAAEQVIRVDVWESAERPETAPQPLDPEKFETLDKSDTRDSDVSGDSSISDLGSETDAANSVNAPGPSDVATPSIFVEKVPSEVAALHRSTSEMPGPDGKHTLGRSRPKRLWRSMTRLSRFNSKVDLTNTGQKRMALINFHGGGFVLGNGTDDARWVAAVMESFHAIVFSVNYRLAPGYPYPVPIEDSIDAILQICARADEFGIDPDKIILSGFSAGGTIALASWVVLQDPDHWKYSFKSPVPKIAGLALFYPLLDWTLSRHFKRQRCAKPDLALSPALTNLFDASYIYPPIPREKRSDPRLSPGLMSDESLAQLPPVHMCLCENDMLLAEGLKFVERAKEAGCTVTTRVVLGEKHAWDKPPPFVPPKSVGVEYQAAIVAMQNWLNEESKQNTRLEVSHVDGSKGTAPFMPE